MRALRRRAGVSTFTVVLQDPKTGLGTADVIWVPEHDRLRGANVFTTLTSPHSFTERRLAELRRAMPPRLQHSRARALASFSAARTPSTSSVTRTTSGLRARFPRSEPSA